MKKSLSITVLLDSATQPKDDDTSQEYKDEQSTEFHIIKVLRELGHTVSVVGIFDDVEPIIQNLKENRPDLVFNLTEQFRNIRWLDKNIAGLLELLDIPFTGAGAQGLFLSRDKAACKQVLGTRKIGVPKFYILPLGKTVKVSKKAPYPLVVKPLMEDASDGISNSSIVKNMEELKARAEWVHDNWKQPAIAEEYIEGRELYVSIIGNKRLKVLPIRELYFGDTDKDGPVMATSRVKWNKKYRVKWNIKFDFSKLDKPVANRIARVCKKAYRLLHIQDYGRIDLRLTPEGKIYILEANSNPDLHYFDEVSKAAQKAGISYPELITSIINFSLTRHSSSH